MTLHDTLIHAVTEYDRRQSTRKGYNRCALGQYFLRIDEVEADIAAGSTPRQAIIAGFLGQLADKLLKAIGEPKRTEEEINHQNIGWGYRPASKA